MKINKLVQAIGILIEKRDRAYLWRLILVTLVTCVSEMVGLASIVPFLLVLTKPNSLQGNGLLSEIYQFTGLENHTHFLLLLGLLLFLLQVGLSAIRAYAQWTTAHFTFGQGYRIARRLFARYLLQPYDFYLNRNSSELARNLLNEVSVVVKEVLTPATNIFVRGCVSLALSILLVVINPGLALSALVAVGSISAASYILARRKLVYYGVQRARSTRQRFQSVAEAFGGIKEVKLFRKEDACLERFRKATAENASALAMADVISDLPNFVLDILLVGGLVAILVGYTTTHGGVMESLPLLGVFALASQRLMPLSKVLFSSFAKLRFAGPALDNITRELALATTGSMPKPRENIVAIPLLKRLSFQNVTYHYPESALPVIDNLSLTVEAHSLTGIVGPTGAGKTTLVDLLLGLHRPQSGRILSDDCEINDANMARWQKGIGYVPQFIYLADDTVAANIAFLELPGERDRDRVEQAARHANLHDFIVSELPNGYDTMIGENGTRLSGGQRQRLGIARALYRDPSILIFDEATSALDQSTESSVMNAIVALSGKKTIVMVTHRMETIKECGVIHVLVKGRMSTSGKFDWLMEHDPTFRAMVMKAKSTSDVPPAGRRPDPS